MQDAGEQPIANATVTLVMPLGSFPDKFVKATDENGFYSFPVSPGSTYEVRVTIPPMPGFQTTPSPANEGTSDLIDSDGSTENMPAGDVGTFVTLEFAEDTSVDFGFTFKPTLAKGTGTPGYWMNHPEAWPVETITIGGVPYSKGAAINLLKAPSAKDKTYTMVSSLVAAKLNVLSGNDSSCIASTIADADSWMVTFGPVGSGVRASSFAWKSGGEELHQTMDSYNNGGMCAPHRD